MVSDKSIIAVVDDEWSVRTMLGRVLRLAGYRVAAFSGGEDFMTSLATRLPECAIVDIHMPRMTGFDVQACLLDAKVPVPVIFITASDDATLDASARQLNVTRVLRKPFSSDELLAAVSAELASSARGSDDGPAVT
jgi:FixJ family two-component response regulator